MKVVDSRSGNTIAQWKDHFNFRKFSVSPDSDITDTLREKVGEGLFRMGFNAKPLEREGERTLRIELLQLKSAYREKLPVLDVRAQAVMRARCANREIRYAATYRDRKKLNSVPPSTFPNDNLINDTLSETLRKMFIDEKLLACLSR